MNATTGMLKGQEFCNHIQKMFAYYGERASDQLLRIWYREIGQTDRKFDSLDLP